MNQGNQKKGTKSGNVEIKEPAAKAFAKAGEISVEDLRALAAKGLPKPGTALSAEGRKRLLEAIDNDEELARLVKMAYSDLDLEVERALAREVTPQERQEFGKIFSKAMAELEAAKTKKN